MAAKNTPMNVLYKSRPEKRGGALLVVFALMLLVDIALLGYHLLPK